MDAYIPTFEHIVIKGNKTSLLWIAKWLMNHSTDFTYDALTGFLTFVQEALGEQVKEVKLSGNLGDHPAVMVPENGMSFEMEKYMKRMNPEFAFPVGRILELNPEHDAVKAMLVAMAEEPAKARDYAKLLCCQAQLMADLPIDDVAEYTRLVCGLMK